MSTYKETRAKLLDLLPYGLVATKKWLMAQGLPLHNIDNLVKSGQLVSLYAGVYKRPDTHLTWQGLVCSLQRMEVDCTVGGVSALELHGFAHYLPLGRKTTVHLYSHGKIPAWINKLLPDTKFTLHTALKLSGDTSMTDTITWGDHQHPLTLSTPELASLELLIDVPNTMSFEYVDQLMQGLTTLSPRRLQKLLEQVEHVKVKRLFFWYAKRHHHPWATKLMPDDFNLGRGKRVVAKQGMLDKQFQITVPKTMAEEQIHG